MLIPSLVVLIWLLFSKKQHRLHKVLHLFSPQWKYTFIPFARETEKSEIYD